MKPQVSVVIPTHNRPELLLRAVRSALNQTHPPHEIVVVLDGQDYVTQAALSTVGDRSVRLVVTPSPVGGGEARNLGVRAATGDYIALLDDDDEWLPSKLAKQVELAERSTSGNFVVVTQYLYRAEGHADEIWPGHLPDSREPLSEFLFSSRGGFQTSTYLCSRTLLLRIPFTKGLKKHQDWDWFLHVAGQPGFQLHIVAEPLSVYHVPLRVRTSTSGKLDWRFSQSWAREQLAWMTRKAYAMFLVKICARSAALQSGGFRSALFLLRELITIGRPTPTLLGEFALAFALPEPLRLRLRYATLRLRGVHLHQAEVPTQELA